MPSRPKERKSKDPKKLALIQHPKSSQRNDKRNFNAPILTSNPKLTPLSTKTNCFHNYHTLPDKRLFNPTPETFLQPKTQPITYDLLIIKAKKILTNLIREETKCININKKQTTVTQQTNKLKSTTKQ